MTAAAAAVAVVRVPSCSETSIVGLASHGNLLGHNLLHDELVSGDARVVGRALLFDGDDPVLGDDPAPPSGVGETSFRRSRVARAVSSGFLRVVCCWSWRRWVGCS